MVGNTGTLTMRLVRSKLRKREESNSATPASLEAQSPNGHHNGFGPQQRNSSNSSGGSACSSSSGRSSTTSSQEQQIFTLNNNNLNNNIINSQDQVITFTRTSGVGNNNNSSSPNTTEWVFPPKAPTPNIYNCINNEAMLAANEKNGFKGLRKQFSGRFKRLVAKKNEPAPAIPPELKPQLKTIYVY